MPFPSATLAALLLALAAPAAAADGEDGRAPPEVDASIALVTDYRFRGVSLSNQGPALQPSLTVTTASGLFANIWGSSIADLNGANTEVDLTFGWSGSFGQLTPSAGVILFFYPGGTDTNYVELFAALEATVGPASLTVGLNVSPQQDNLLRSDRYIYGAAAVAVIGTPLTVNASLGFERGGLVADETGQQTLKTDWRLGVDASFDAVTLGIAWVGSNLPGRFAGGPRDGERANRGAGNGVVLSFTAAF